jgi:hypothetical protein
MKTALVLHDRTRSIVTRHRARLGATTLWLLGVGLVVRLAAGSIVETASVTLAWDPLTTNVDGTPLTDLSGYRLYCGATSQVYTTVIDVGPDTTATVTNRFSGPTYFFAVTAYNAVGTESALSTEVAWTRSAVDSDGDGMTDSDELLACTDPDDPTSVLQMNRSYRPAGVGETGIVVEWTGVAGVHYTLERSTNLTAGPAFTTVVSVVPGRYPATVYMDTTATESGPYYYRARVNP